MIRDEFNTRLKEAFVSVLQKPQYSFCFDVMIIDKLALKTMLF